MTKTFLTLLALGVTISCLATPAGGAADTFSPTTLSDNTGNQADQSKYDNLGKYPSERDIQNHRY